jgi:transposase
VSMTNPADRVEIITSVQRRRRWTASEKVRIVEETFEPGMTVSLVARRHGVAPNQLFTWRRLVVEGALTAAGSGEQVVPASAACRGRVAFKPNSACSATASSEPSSPRGNRWP